MATGRKRSTRTTSRRRLGRGLGSLIQNPVQIDRPEESPDGETEHGAAATATVLGLAADASMDAGPAIRMLKLEAIQPSARQPRQRFDTAALKALADSIKAAGLMQPIVVRPHPAGGFELIAGERRWRAAQIAELPHIPAVVRDVDDQTATQWSLIENLQREDLNPIERAEAFERLGEEFSLTQQEIAEKVGLDRSSVSNHLRLLALDEPTKDALRAGQLTLGHGKALLAITNIETRAALARQALRGGLSVRSLEGRVRAALRGDGKGASRPRAAQPHMADLERRLSEHLGTNVRIRPGRKKGAGTLMIDFYNLDQFEGLMQRIQFVSDT